MRRRRAGLTNDQAVPDVGGAGLFDAPDAAPTRAPPPVLGRRLLVLRGVLLAALTVLLAQSVRLQLAAGFSFRREAEGNRVRELVVYAPRGIFLDRTGEPLVQNVPAMELVAEPSALPDDLEPLFIALKQALPGRNLDPIRTTLQTLNRDAVRLWRGTENVSIPESALELVETVASGSPVPVLSGLTHQEFLALSARADQLRGLRIETTAVRDYRGDGAFAHVLGYQGKVSTRDRAAFPGYLLTEAVGKDGLERQYEQLLRGRHGARRVEVDALGAVQQDLGVVPPVPGANLRLHLDAALQEWMAATLGDALTAAGLRRGAAVAIDPFSGAVRGLVSFPSFPQDAFAEGLSPDSAEKVFADPGSPLLNRVTQGQYVPGSTFKLALAAGALEEGIVTPETTVQSEGGIRVGSWFFPDWKAGGHGRTNLTKALAESVNTYFYRVAGGFGDQPGLGIERIDAWAERIGFGDPTGIDLPGERQGFLPTPSWKQRVKGEAWYIGDTYHAAIGQGDVLITPLQLALATSVIANGGTLYTPQLLSTVEDSAGTVRERIPPAVRAERVIRPETAAAIRSGMRAAVTDGSGKGLSTLPIPVAAKTGTAQVGGTERTHAWVTAFAPFEQPKLVLVVLLEQAGGGDRFAVPVARDVLSWYFSPDRQRPP